MDRLDRGQSTVEFALVLPLVVLLLLAILQGGVLLKDQLLVSSAAREGAREAAVSSDVGRIRAAASRAAPGLRLQVGITRGPDRGDAVEVRVEASPTRLPLVGAITSGHRLAGRATMRVERSS